MQRSTRNVLSSQLGGAHLFYSCLVFWVSRLQCLRHLANLKACFETHFARFLADHSVGARNELHESEASEASVFCFWQCFPWEVLLRGRSSLFYFAMPTSFCVVECHQKWIEIVQRSRLRENSGSMEFAETKEVSRRSPRELKFVRDHKVGGSY